MVKKIRVSREGTFFPAKTSHAPAKGNRIKIKINQLPRKVNSTGLQNLAKTSCQSSPDIIVRGLQNSYR